MNHHYYLDGIVHELRLLKLFESAPRSAEFLGGLDEAIEAQLTALSRQKLPPKDVLKGPGFSAPKKFVDVWKRRAKETIDLYARYRKLEDGPNRDLLRHKLQERHIRIADYAR